MKQILKYIFLLSINTFFITASVAQSSKSEIVTTNKNEFNIPPLKVILDSVIKRSAMIKFRKNHIAVKESTLASERIYWTRNIGIQADGRYGTLNNFSNTQDEVSTTAFSTLSTQYNYSIGVYLKFPVFDMLNRKNQLQLAKAEIEEAKNMAEFQVEEVRQATIKLYQDLILKQKLLQIKSESLSNGKVNFQMVEKEFTNGLVPIAEYVRISSMNSNMETDYELAKSEYLIAKQILEDIAGFVFNVTRSN